jgi:murein DD-endopeptidase MepM/ murein hydrolase activator NlpD
VLHMTMRCVLAAWLACAASCGGGEWPTNTDFERERSDNNLACKHYDSTVQEYAPVQRVGSPTGGKLLPPGYAQFEWQRPASVASPNYFAPFTGSPGQLASHEGVDYVNNSSGPAVVAIRAATAGLVVYVRLGCPQSCMFCHNTWLRECGAGWGNHVVIYHGSGVYTRYAHLKPSSVIVEVGDQVGKGQQIAQMGNSGRSELRHLHFELGTMPNGFDACATSQSFHRVYNSQQLPFGNQVSHPEHYGKIHCPTGYKLEKINAAGGVLCVTGSHKYDPGAEAFGPFTEKMKQRCHTWGGGDPCYQKDNWSRPMAESAYGDGTCPEGAAQDAETGYCVEGSNGFGPFPPAMIDICECDPNASAENLSKGCLGGGQACKKARWHVSVMRAAYNRAYDTP